MGDLNLNVGPNTLIVARTAGAGSAQLNANSLIRSGTGGATRGTLFIQSSAANTLGIPNTTPTSYDRLVLTGSLTGSGLVRGGTTLGGAGVLSAGSGMLAPWIIDITNQTFVGYNPTGSAAGFGGLDTGFQPIMPVTGGSLLTAGSLGFALNGNGTLGATPGLVPTTGLETVNLTGTTTVVTGGTTAYAVRLQGGTLSGGSMSLTSGGLIYLGNSASDVISSTLVAGGGTGELVLYSPNSANGFALSGQIYAAGLTKFGGGDVRLAGDNRGTLTGPVTISGNNWFRLLNLNALGGSLCYPYQ